MLFAGREYTFVEEFDCNLTLDYENDRWEIWHIVRELVSNALDSTGGNADRVTITNEGGYISIADDGPGYLLFFAKRIGASSKRQDYSSIGQFGEGQALSILVCLRKGINIRIASQDWLIIPKAVPVEEGMRVLVFDIYKTDDPIQGSIISIEDTDDVSHYIKNIGCYFLHFGKHSPLHGTMSTGIYPKDDGSAALFNKGVRIKGIEALYSYGITISELNRDRDLINDAKMCEQIRAIWENVDDENLISAYFKESNRAATSDSRSNLVEFSDVIYPIEWNKSFWKGTFYHLFSENSVIYTEEFAAREACAMGSVPIKLDYCGRKLAEHVGIERDIDVVNADYEYTWTDGLTKKESERLQFFREVAQLVGFELPQEIRVFDDYAKSEWISGVYDPEADRILIKREALGRELPRALDTFIHELTHRHTRADDYSRTFADGLTELAAQLVMELVKRSGFPIKVKLTDRGFQMPLDFSYSGETILSRIALLGDEVIIQTAGRTMRALLPVPVPKPYCAERMATFYKGRFYVNVPANIREALPSEVIFYVRQDLEQL